MINFEPGEKVIKVVRRHYLVMLPLVFVSILAGVAPFFLYRFLLSGLVPIDPNVATVISNFVADWAIFSYSLWLLILWVVFFIEWTDYYLDLWIITDKRILDIEQKGFFHRDVTSFSYNQIQDITVETRGFIETMFKFGTLHVQTAGENRQILIRDAHYPEDARSLILRLQDQSKSI